MPIIKYSSKVKTINHKSNVDYSFNNLRFGDRPKSSEMIREVKNLIDSPTHLSDGWYTLPEISQDGSLITIPNSPLIQDGAVILPSLSGLSVSATNEVRLDTAIFEKFLGTDPVMGIKSIGSGRNASAHIFRRKFGKLSIHKTYEYKDINLSLDPVGSDQFTEISVDGQSYILFGINKPIPISEIRGSNASVGINDYLKLSFDFSESQNILGLNEDNFLECCDYYSVEDLGLRKWDVKDLSISLKTEYFPIYNQVTVIAQMEDGLYQVGINYAQGVNSNRGVIEFDGAFADGLGLGDCLGFYIFYGVVPSVYLDSGSILIREEDILSDARSISHIGVDNREKEGQVSVSEPNLTLVRDVNYSSISTDIHIPEFYDNVFIEPSAPIVINGKLYGPSSSAGKSRMFLRNKGVEKLEFSAPDHIFDLIQVADFISEDKIKIHGSLVSEAAAVYGLFDYTDVKRLTLLSSYSPSSSSAERKSLDAVGFGEGPYSAGGFSQGQLNAYNSTITYNIPNNNIFNSFNKNMAVQVKPEDDGYEIILPAWTTGNKITIQEVGSRSATMFVDWEFIGPDVIILDKNKADRKRIYNIVFEAIASPIIPNINLNDNTIDVIINSPPGNVYPGYKGMYVLGSKTVSASLGYINPLGGRSYFSNKINIELVITKEYLQKVITGLKSIIF